MKKRVNIGGVRDQLAALKKRDGYWTLEGEFTVDKGLCRAGGVIGPWGEIWSDIEPCGVVRGRYRTLEESQGCRLGCYR